MESRTDQFGPDSRVIPVERRHDLDALRATAMLLGIGLHSALSFMRIPWPVQDSQQSELFGLVFVAVHGFRMPLFFVISGFFTAMVWRRRGIRELLRQRVTRVLAPCLLGLLTIIPLLHGVTDWVFSSGRLASAAGPVAGDPVAVDLVAEPPRSLIEAIRRQSLVDVERFLQDPASLRSVDAEFGIRPLAWAVMSEREEIVRLLVHHGAGVDEANVDGTTPLHAAALLGNRRLTELLIAWSADPLARSRLGHTPVDATRADWETTQYVASLLKLRLPPRKDLVAGRAECRSILAGAVPRRHEALGPVQRVRKAYADFLSSERWNLGWTPSGVPFHLVDTRLFEHLWFLWFLWWFVVAFATLVSVSRLAGDVRVRLGNGSGSNWQASRRGGFPEQVRVAVLSPLRICWLLPLTLLPQMLMGTRGPSIGPDTSVGLVPQPHLLLYYGVFFGYGVLYYLADDFDGRVGRWWWLSCPLALVVALPLALTTMADPVVGGIVQVVYAWLMTWSMIGMFRRLLTRESRFIRYVSDSSYWLYLSHVPLVIAGQHVIREWRIAPGLKYLGLCVGVTAVLLASYQVLVRPTWIGRMLNGKRSSSK